MRQMGQAESQKSETSGERSDRAILSMLRYDTMAAGMPLVGVQGTQWVADWPAATPPGLPSRPGCCIGVVSGNFLSKEMTEKVTEIFSEFYFIS